MQTSWRITFPIEKAEKRDDGYFLTGLASGPEIDATDERMDQDLVYRYADQINSAGGLALDDHLPYRDAHAPDGVMRDLGWLWKAWINDEQRLAVEVKLDDLNPAAMYLFRQVNDRKKKYGMSVAGKVLDYVDEWISEVGKTIRTYKDVILTEISNTTRPAWTPSFGSVLAKAISDTQSVGSGDSTAAQADVTPTEVTMGDEIKDAQKTEEPTPAVEPAVEPSETPEVSAEETAPAADDTEKSLYDAASMAWTLGDVVSLLGYTSSESAGDLKNAANALLSFISSEVGTAAKAKMDAEKSAPAEDETEAPAPAAEDEAAPEAGEGDSGEPVAAPEAEKADEAPDGDALAKALATAISAALSQFGLAKHAPEAPAETLEAPAPQADSTETPESTEKAEETPSETTPAPSYEELAAALAEKTAKVEELEAAPLTQLPPVVERSTDPNTLGKAMEGLSRSERLRVAMAAQTGGR